MQLTFESSWHVSLHEMEKHQWDHFQNGLAQEYKGSISYLYIQQSKSSRKIKQPRSLKEKPSCILSPQPFRILDPI